MTEQEPASGDAATLLRLFDYLQGADEDIHNAIVAEVTNDPYWRDQLQGLLDQGFGIDDAAETIAEGGLGSAVAERERLPAELQYRGFLETAGLDFFPGSDITDLEVIDVRAFTNLLARLDLPADEAKQQELRAGLTHLTQDLLLVVAHNHIYQDTEAATEAAGGEQPWWLSLQQQMEAEGGVEPPTEADLALSREVGERATIMAEELDRLGIDPHQSGGLRQLLVAQEEGLLMEWAIAVDLQIIGSSNSIATDRMMSELQWQRVYRFLDHLHDIAPEADFTQEARQTLLADIETEISRPFDPLVEGYLIDPNANYIPPTLQALLDTAVPEGRLEEGQIIDLDPETAITIRTEQREHVLELLQRAKGYVNTLLPPPPSAASGNPSGPAVESAGTSVGDIQYNLMMEQQALQEIALAISGARERLLQVQGLLMRTFVGIANENADNSILMVETAITRLEAYLRLSATAIEHFQRYNP